MPFVIPLSIKVAVTAGALAGATIAVVNNKENVLRGAEYILQKGADFCRQKLEKAHEMNMHFAESHEDGAFASGYSYDESTGDMTPEEMESDKDYATTPDASDSSDSSDEELDMLSLD